jgi:hypothetical protein
MTVGVGHGSGQRPIREVRGNGDAAGLFARSCGQRADFFLDLWEVSLLCQAQVVFALEIEPELGVHAEIKTKPQGGIGANSPFAGYDQLKGRLRNTRTLSYPVNGQIVGSDEFG